MKRLISLCGAMLCAPAVAHEAHGLHAHADPLPILAIIAACVILAACRHE